jgi:hypothetical protein
MLDLTSRAVTNDRIPPGAESRRYRQKIVCCDPFVIE